MNAAFDPREVEKPFAARWVRMTWQLFVRAPVRFGACIAALGWLDHVALNVAQGYVVPRHWVEWLGMVLVPVCWLPIAALARGADDPTQGRVALIGLLRVRVWTAALLAGAPMAAFSWLIASIMGNAQGGFTYVQSPGRFLASVAAPSILISGILGFCYCPLLMFGPDLPIREARRLSLRAEEINDRKAMNWFRFIFMLCLSVPAALLPLAGVTSALLIVLSGTLNYVVYRDMFERRSGNEPAIAASTPAVSVAANAEA